MRSIKATYLLTYLCPPIVVLRWKYCTYRQTFFTIYVDGNEWRPQKSHWPLKVKRIYSDLFTAIYRNDLLFWDLTPPPPKRKIESVDCSAVMYSTRSLLTVNWMSADYPRRFSSSVNKCPANQPSTEIWNGSSFSWLREGWRIYLSRVLLLYVARCTTWWLFHIPQEEEWMNEWINEWMNEWIN